MAYDETNSDDGKPALLKRIEECYKKSRNHSKDWRKEAKRCFDYVAGHQWTTEEITELEDKSRPPVVFNKIEIFVGAVTGLEALNRQEVKFFQRAPGQPSPYELLNAAAKYVNDDSDAEDHHSHAFRDLVTCGMGWTETRIDFSTNPDGDVRIERVDPIEMFWDCYATQRCLSDARYVIRIKRGVTKDEIEEKWPGKADDIEPNDLFLVPDDQDSPHDATQAPLYRNDVARGYGKDYHVIIQFQWFDIEHIYRVATPRGMMEFDTAQWERMRKEYPAAENMRAVKVPRRRYKQAFVAGKTILEEGDAPSQSGFTLQCMTGKHDRNKNIWFGLVRSLFDPQDWTNKLFSQILHIINTNAKGGLVAEEDAFADVREAEDDWAKADSIVWANPGAISGQKIMPKPPPPYPQGMDKLMTVAISMFPEVSGMNLELLGLAEKVQPGVLEAQRKQAGMTVLAWAFDAMRKYRKAHGRVLAEFIRQYISDGRLIRVAGEDQQQYIPLVRDALAVEYDLIVDEAPSSPNQKERVFAILTQLLPMLVDAGVPLIPEMLEYSPLPTAMVEKWKQAMRPNPKDAQRVEVAKDLQVADAQAGVQEKQSKVQLNLAKADAEKMKAIGL